MQALQLQARARGVFQIRGRGGSSIYRGVSFVAEKARQGQSKPWAVNIAHAHIGSGESTQLSQLLLKRGRFSSTGSNHFPESDSFFAAVVYRVAIRY